MIARKSALDWRVLDLDKGKFRKRFPKLSEEVSDAVTSIPVEDSVEEDDEEVQEVLKAEEVSTVLGAEQLKKPVRSFDGYDPTTVDFIRRCGSEKEAHEIIDYMERKAEIGRGEAQAMRGQLRAKGLRSFGAKKEYGYYLKNVE